MNQADPDYIEAAEAVISLIKSEGDAAFAEVGGVNKQTTQGVLTETETRSFSTFPETGVWCRPFISGASEYGYVSDPDDSALSDFVGRVTRAARHLAQERNTSHPASTLRTTHPGWDAQQVEALSANNKEAALTEALTAVRESSLVERARLEYTDTYEKIAFLTTEGTALHLERQRASVALTIQPTNGPKIRRFLGTTRPEELWTEVGSFVSDAFADAQENAVTDDTIAGECIQEPATILLRPQAAGQLFHLLSHYYEADMHLMGLSPYEFGEEVAADAITIRDTVVDGAWGALAYDAEGRPTTPTTLVRDGKLVALLHDTATAVEFEQRPAGNAIPSLDYDHPPRIHARHLDIMAGESDFSDLLIGSEIVVNRFGPAQFEDEVEKTGREGWMPASSLYATEIADHSPDPDRVGHLQLPIAEGKSLSNREQVNLSDYAVEISPDTLKSVTALSKDRETTGYVCTKHKSSVPVSVSTPSLQLRSTIAHR